MRPGGPLLPCSIVPARIDPRTRRRIRAALLAWYAADHRDFPWRGTTDPYAVLVSEVMLQQTQAVAGRRRDSRASWRASRPPRRSRRRRPPPCWRSGAGSATTVARSRCSGAAAVVSRDGWPRDVAGLERPARRRAVHGARRRLARLRHAGRRGRHERAPLAAAPLRRPGRAAPAPGAWPMRSPRRAAAPTSPPGPTPRWSSAPPSADRATRGATPARSRAAAPRAARPAAVPVPRQARAARLGPRLPRRRPAPAVGVAAATRSASAALRARHRGRRGRIGPALDDDGWERDRRRRSKRDGLVHRSRGRGAAGRRLQSAHEHQADGRRPASLGRPARHRWVPAQPAQLRHQAAGPAPLLRRPDARRRRPAHGAEGHRGARGRATTACARRASRSPPSAPTRSSSRPSSRRRRSCPSCCSATSGARAVELLGIETVADGANVNVAKPVAIAVDRDGIVRAVIEPVEPDALVDQLDARPVGADPAPPPKTPPPRPERRTDARRAASRPRRGAAAGGDARCPSRPAPRSASASPAAGCATPTSTSSTARRRASSCRVTLGHEVAGWIDAVGPDAERPLRRTRLRRVTRVVVSRRLGLRRVPRVPRPAPSSAASARARRASRRTAATPRPCSSPIRATSSGSAASTRCAPRRSPMPASPRTAPSGARSRG